MLGFAVKLGDMALKVLSKATGIEISSNNDEAHKSNLINYSKHNTRVKISFSEEIDEETKITVSNC